MRTMGKKNFPQPKLIQMYNAHMGGVDLGDQRMATCSRLMKGSIWYYKIFFHMFEVAMLNAHVLYQNAGHQRITLSQFKEKLVRQLMLSPMKDEVTFVNRATT